MNKIVKLAVVLFLVCAIIAGILGVVNLITAATITSNAVAGAVAESIKAVESLG